MNRRDFLGRVTVGAASLTVAGGASALAPAQTSNGFRPSRSLAASESALQDSGFSMPVGEGTLTVISDGQMQLPGSWLHPEGSDDAEIGALLERYGLTDDTYTPDCNVTIWQSEERTVLFDAGGGTQFMPSLGNLPAALEEAGIDPQSVTDVVFTHAHPDHLWGLLDDFGDVLYTDARFHIHDRELAYWLAEDTLSKTPENRQPFVVGAQSRLAMIKDQISVFNWGDEILPGIEAVDTRGHTPGHSSFALHHGDDSILVVGDALSNIALSFEKPRLPSESDQEPEVAIETRLSLLDRLAAEQMRIVAYHLPTPAFGRVERKDSAYRFFAEDG